MILCLQEIEIGVDSVLLLASTNIPKYISFVDCFDVTKSSDTGD